MFSCPRAPVVAFCLGTIVAAGTACASPAERVSPEAPSGQPGELGRIREAVDRALVAEPPRGYAAIPRGVRVLSVGEREDGTIVLNLSGELLVAPQQVIEDALRQILDAAAGARAPRPGQPTEFQVLVNGVTLESYLP